MKLELVHFKANLSVL